MKLGLLFAWNILKIQVVLLSLGNGLGIRSHALASLCKNLSLKQLRFLLLMLKMSFLWLVSGTGIIYHKRQWSYFTLRCKKICSYWKAVHYTKKKYPNPRGQLFLSFEYLYFACSVENQLCCHILNHTAELLELLLSFLIYAPYWDALLYIDRDTFLYLFEVWYLKD